MSASAWLWNKVLPSFVCLRTTVFNSIELIWAWIKGKVAKENKTFKIEDVIALTKEAISAATADQWRSACLHCMTLVDEFWKTDCLQEETVEQLVN